MGLKIFIPTRGRVANQVTRKDFCLDALPFPHKVIYVVPECEAKQWQGVSKLVVPDEFKFSDIRQKILGYRGDYHVVIDDDLRVSKRLDRGSTKLTSIRKFDFRVQLQLLGKLWKEIVEVLDSGFVHGGVSVRQGNNHVEQLRKVVSREMRFHFYNSRDVKDLEYDFRRTVTKQDLDFTLWMLRRGIPNVVLFGWAQEQYESTEGGCSRYRTREVLTEGAYRLQELHPSFVKVVKKTPKSEAAWDKGRKRVDVNIQWQKAYKQGMKYVEDLRRQDPKTLDHQNRVVLRLQPEL